jgi:hypothetical protein
MITFLKFIESKIVTGIDFLNTFREFFDSPLSITYPDD